MPRLRIVGEDGAERNVELTERDLRIGRAPENDLVLPDQAKGVSRMHAELRFESGRYFIIDLNSQNGTWIDGRRVQRAEVPPNAEIAIGSYRLTLQRDPTEASTIDTQVSQPVPADPARPTATLVAPGRAAAAGAVAPSATPPRKSSRSPARGQEAAKPGLIAALARMPKPILFGGFLVIVVVVVVLGQLMGPTESPAQNPAGTKSTVAPEVKPAGESSEQLKASETLQQQKQAVPAETPAPSAPPADAASVPAMTAPAQGGMTPGGTTPAAPVSSTPPAPSLNVTAAPPTTTKTTTPRGSTPARGTQNVEPPVARRPGESVQGWRSRAGELQQKYTSARAALDRGEFATAAIGFDAILKEEPGFMDAPALFIRARQGQRASARDAFEAGNKLDTAGEWVAALQKYDQARQLDPSVAGLDDATRRLREKMRAAGTDALKRARQYDALGRTADALKDYEKAAQWLPLDDPNRKIARDRADQLKAGLK